MGMILKIILIVAVCIAVLFGKRILRSLQQGRSDDQRLDRDEQRTITGLDRCTVCGAYVDPKGDGACGRADCPHAP